MIVLVMILLLTVMTSGHLSTSAAKRTFTECRGNLQKVYIAVSFYKSDNNGAYPFVAGAENPAQPLSLLIPKCTTTTEIFICPGSKDGPLPEGESFAKEKISYACYMGRGSNDGPDEAFITDAQVNDLAKVKGQQIFSVDGKKPGNNHGKRGGNILCLGGEVTQDEATASRDYTIPASVRLLNPK